MGLEIIRNGNNVVGIACSREKKNKCYACGRPSTSLCDATRKDGKPCDLPMCDFHRNRVGDKLIDVDVCHYHNSAKYKKQAIKNRKKLKEDMRSVANRFKERTENSSFKLVPGHYPDFTTAEEVDEWFDNWERMNKKTFDYVRNKPWICPVCENKEKNKDANYCKICGTKIEKDTKREVE